MNTNYLFCTHLKNIFGYHVGSFEGSRKAATNVVNGGQYIDKIVYSTENWTIQQLHICLVTCSLVYKHTLDWTITNTTWQLFDYDVYM